MRRLAILAALLVLNACVSAPPPLPSSPPVTVPAPPPASVLGPDWRDWPITPGTWRYAKEASGSLSLFGAAEGMTVFIVRCNAGQHLVTLTAIGAPAPGARMTITTSSGNTSYAVQAGTPNGSLSLSAFDPVLDKMAFSRGRFIIDVTGLTKLIVPAWPEFARVAEDCRS